MTQKRASDLRVEYAHGDRAGAVRQDLEVGRRRMENRKTSTREQSRERPDVDLKGIDYRDARRPGDLHECQIGMNRCAR